MAEAKRDLAERIVCGILRDICDGTYGPPQEWSLTEWHAHEDDCPHRGEGTVRVCCLYEKFVKIVRNELANG